MNPLSRWRPLACAWLACTAAALHAAPEPSAQGLIVRLKDAPSHERLQSRSADGLVEREAVRWQRVLADSGLSGTSGQRQPGLRAVGRDQQLLDFGRSLSAAEVAQLKARLLQRADVAWVEANVRERRLQVPTDPRYPSQWWLREAGGTNANAIADRLRGVPGFLRAWQSGLAGSTGRPAAVVAVLDTGITAHPDLEGRILPGYDFVSETAYSNDGNGRDADPTDPGDWVSSSDRNDAAFKDCEIEDSSWHGTIISALVAAATNNGVGVAGINQDGRVLPVRVAGKCGAAVADIIDGMRWAAGLSVAGVPSNPNPARIINISFGGSAACGDAYLSAINELRAAGAIVVAAAGNEFGAPTRPASCSGAVGVVALNRDGFKTNYSNFGSVLSASGIATVGGDDSAGGWGDLLTDGGLFTAWNDGFRQVGTPGYSSMYGTSFSAPLVAGAASLMLSVNPALTAAQLVDGLRRSARPHVTSPRIGTCSSANPGRCICTTDTCGAGILDAEQALLFAANPGSYVAPAREAAIIDNPEVVQAAARGQDRSGSTTPTTPPVTDPGTGSSSGGGSSGGGAMEAGWLVALALATGLLLARRPRRG